jgi:hypothetical protein
MIVLGMYLTTGLKGKWFTSEAETKEDAVADGLIKFLNQFES